MRVTAGKYKGKKLIERPFEHIRPTADMVKQSIFNKLQFELVGAKVLDLFCGTGALGIEALSRGAKQVFFVDLDLRSIKLTRDNLKSMGNPTNTNVIQADYKKAIEKLEGNKFNIIILDPPYKSGVYEECLNLIAYYKLLSNDGIIVCEQEKSVKIDYAPFEVIDEKIYGIKKVAYLKNTY